MPSAFTIVGTFVSGLFNDSMKAWMKVLTNVVAADPTPCSTVSRTVASQACSASRLAPLAKLSAHTRLRLINVRMHVSLLRCPPQPVEVAAPAFYVQRGPG
jgi:hypothetical protein